MLKSFAVTASDLQYSGFREESKVCISSNKKIIINSEMLN